MEVPEKNIYYRVFAALVALTLLTIWAARVDLGPFNTPVALVIACGKSLLVVLFFMHLRYSTRVTWLLAGAGIYWLVILIALTLSDYLSRGWMAGLAP